MEGLERVDPNLEHELDVAASNVNTRREKVHQKGAPVSKGRHVAGHQLLLVRKGHVGGAELGVGILGVHRATEPDGGALDGNLARFAQRVL